MDANRRRAAFAGYRLLRRPSSTAQLIAFLAGIQHIRHRRLEPAVLRRTKFAASTVAAAAMIGGGAAYIAQARKVDRTAAVAGVPLVAWVAFATILTGAVWRRSRVLSGAAIVSESRWREGGSRSR
ncbi:MAG: tryptophan-rich sensory protein [Pyrinomonadaceae bacterium]